MSLFKFTCGQYLLKNKFQDNKLLLSHYNKALKGITFLRHFRLS